MLKAVITADIVNSRKQEPRVWLQTLQTELKLLGHSPQDWEIYRGDSFQCLLNPEHALNSAFQLKAALMQHKELNIRMAIGIGEVSHRDAKVTQSNGPAFIRSGTRFDNLEKDEMLALHSPWDSFDETINLLLRLLTKLTNDWTPHRARLVREYLRTPEATQKELGERLDKKQGNLSLSLSKAGYDELQRVLTHYRTQLQLHQDRAS